MAQVSQTKQAKEELVKQGKAPAPKQELEVVPNINAKALQKDVGPKVIDIFSRSLGDASEAADLLLTAQGKKYEAMSLLTLGILKVAMNDQNVKLASAFSGDRKLMETLNKQLGIALGYREVSTVLDGDKQVQRVVIAKSVAKYFPGPKDDQGSPEYQRKNTFRANFATAVKTCAQAAEGLILAKATAVYDEKEKTLRIGGPKVKEVFGQDSVLLNESTKQGETALEAKPSFTAIRALAGEEHDAPVHRGTNTRGTTVGQTKPTDPDTNLISMAHMLIQGIGKYEGALSAKVREALDGVINTINEKMKVTV